MIPAFALNTDGIMDLFLEGEGQVIVKCDICDSTIASAYLEELSLPLKTDMFKSPDPYHGAPAPWLPGLGWEVMFCPVCHNKFAIFPGHRIKTSRGYFDVPVGKSLQGRAEEARVAHTPEVAGSTPAPAIQKKTAKKGTGGKR